MADYFTKFSFCVDLPTEAAQAYALDLAARAQHHFWDPDEPPPPNFPAGLLAGFQNLESVNWGFTTEESGQGDGIWIHADYGGRGANVACLFVQHLLQEFNPTGRVTFEWSHDCSSPRTDAHGGGAAFITAQEIRTISTSQWLGEQHA